LGFKKIGVFYQNDDYGKQGIMGVERYLKEKKIDPVAKVSAEVTDRDLSTHALKLKDAGAEAVVMWCMPTHAALILGETAKIGFKPHGRQAIRFRLSTDGADYEGTVGWHD
jgi:ABC-type branched-subunit amino acid transport system substrate-binding protein